MPTYKYNGETYDIPDGVVADFERDMPDATVAYQVGSDIYDIPLREREGFLQSFPTASLYEEKVKEQAKATDPYQPEIEADQPMYGTMGMSLDGSAPADNLYYPSPLSEEGKADYQPMSAEDRARQEYEMIDAQLRAFDEQNGAFMGEYAEKEKASRWANADPNQTFAVNPNEDYLNANYEQYRGMLEERGELITRKRENSYYQQMLKSRVDESAATADNLSGMQRDLALNNPELEKEIALWRAQAASGAMPRLDKPISQEALDYRATQQDLRAAEKLYREAAEIYAAPSANGEDIFLNFGKGFADPLNEQDFWTMGITKIIDNVNAREAFQKIQDKFGSIKELGSVTEEQIDALLTPSERLLVAAVMDNLQAQMARRDDTSGAYEAGQGAADSAMFMAQFLMLGGLGSAAETAAHKSVVNWLGRQITSINNPILKAVVRETGKTAIGTLESLGKALITTPLMPHTYVNITDKLMSFDDKGELMDATDAVFSGAMDALVETWSESTGAFVERVLGAPGNVVKKGARKFLKDTPFANWGKMMNAPAMRILRRGGFNGFLGEMGEEFIGNAVRSMTGLDPDAFSEFVKMENLFVTAGAFAPMTVLGLGASGAQYGFAKRKLDNAQKAFEGILANMGYTQEQIKFAVDELLATTDAYLTPQRLVEKFTPFLRELQYNDRYAGEKGEAFGAALDFMTAIAGYRTFDGVYHRQQEEQNADMQREIQEGTGREFWTTRLSDKAGLDGTAYEVNEVRAVEFKDGRVAYVLGNDGVNNAVVYNDGQTGFLSEEQIAEEKTSGNIVSDATMGLNDYLTQQNARVRMTAEETRMFQERGANIGQVRAQFPLESTVELGTEEAPVQGIVRQVLGDGVIAESPAGISFLTWEDLGRTIGIEVNPKTDAQMDEEAINNLEIADLQRRRERERRRAERNAQGTTETEAELEAEQAFDEAENEGLEKPIPMKADGTVDQTAFWNESPARWAQWKTEQRQDGGAYASTYIQNAINILAGQIAESEAAFLAESDFDAKDALERTINQQKARLAELQDLAMQYMPTVIPTEATGEATAETSQAAEVMAERQKFELDKEYQRRLSLAKSLAEKEMILKEYFEAISAGSMEAVVMNKGNYKKLMRENGCTEEQIQEVADAIKVAEERNQAVDALYANGKVFVVTEYNSSVERGRLSYVHERQHGITKRRPELIQRILSLGLSRETLQNTVKILANGSEFYNDKSDEVLADEILSFTMEKGYTYDNFSVILSRLGLPIELINTLNEINDEQRKDFTLVNARRNENALESGSRTGRQDDRDQEEVSSGVLGQEGVRPTEDSDGRGENGEPAEGAEVNPSDNEGPSFRITPEMDAEYLAAVESGDMNKAQQMVFAAAKIAMPDTKVPGVVYHGTRSTDGRQPYNIIDNGHFTDDYGFAEYYANASGNGYVYNAFLNIERPLIYDFKGQNSDNAVDENGERITTFSIIERARKEGNYDGVILKNVDEYGSGVEEEGGEYPGTITDYIPLSPSQIKSAEPVTYDDNGNVIPLSERFNPNNNDIRFRTTETNPEDNLSEETVEELADKGLVMDGGVIMSDEYAELKQTLGYETPIERGAGIDDLRFAVVTMPGWKKNYLTYEQADKRIVQILEAFAARITANELVNGVIAKGTHKSSKKTKDGKLVEAGPLRSNISYVVTFDLDTTCPRTFQYLNFVRKIERRIGRPLTQVECIQLNEMMRMYGQQIPCVYCYAENKRQAMKQYFNNYITARHAVLSAETDAEALEHMYGREKEGTNPETVLTEAAYKVFKKWRKNPKGKYNPTMRILWHQYDQARNSVLSLLDMRYAEGVVNTDSANAKIAQFVAGELGITNKTAVREIEEIVVEWKWNTIEGRKHDDYTPVEEDDLYANENALEVWRDMVLYAKSASGAKNVNRYVPYTDELKHVDQATRDYINGMGGLRMHSTNDFRIDYVFDYFQFMADMAAARMFGHTYTKSPEFVRIFGNSGYKINMSIAAYQDENGVIRPNVDEGFDWDEVKELRRLFPHAGAMLMATSDEQLQMALDSDWIDMIIPFHHSGLPKAVWYNMRLWTDYTTVQNESFLNTEERTAMLLEAGVEIPRRASTETIEELFNEHFGIEVQYGKSGKRVKPHFLPGPTIVDGVNIPGHNNDHQRYLELCRQWGVKPRFQGIKVKDNTPEGGGREVDITEHPRYMTLVKETARTDSPQVPIQFNFDQPSEALGGRSAMDYAFDELEARAMAESELAGRKVNDIYTSLNNDQFGIVDQFINTIIKHKQETGEDYPMDYLTPESREWFMVQRKALEEAFKDIATIPYHRNEYDEQGNLVSGPGLNLEEKKVVDIVDEAKKAQKKHDAKAKKGKKSKRSKKDDVRLRVTARTDEQREKLFDKAKQQYGVTNNFNATGYMLPDGSLLDFSESNDGGDPNRRSLDHRDIEGIIMDEGREYDSRYRYIVDFVNEGAIRMLPESAGFQLSVPPTAEQRSRLMDYIYKHNGEVIMEITDENGSNVAYVEYDRRTSPYRVMSDVDKYFNRGETPAVSFRISNNNQAIFVSNAAKAVEAIKQEKATPEQWLKMIEKAGGLKAGEDKWMGLSDWLKASDKKTLTKAEVLDFVNENMIQIEETHYDANAEDKASDAHSDMERILQEKLNAYKQEWYEENENESLYGDPAAEYAIEKLREELGDEFPYAFELNGSEVYLKFPYEEDADMRKWSEKLGVEYDPNIRQISDIRLGYTTDDLTNKHEIALTVPTIEPWNQNDETHFGDAGNGRAIAWIRFGETKGYSRTEQNDELQSFVNNMLQIYHIDEQAEVNRFGGVNLPDELLNALTDEQFREFQGLKAASMASSDETEHSILVIDEIQSKRHQEGRERGYIPTEAGKKKLEENYKKAQAAFNALDEEMMQKYGDLAKMTKEETEVYNATARAYTDAYYEMTNPRYDFVPDAPFDKNWHELAMKRMLRYAAENGYDAIAWTKGDQQNNRYGLSGAVKSIDINPQKEEHYVGLRLQNGGYQEMYVDRDGKIVQGQYYGRNLSDVVGKEMADRILNITENTTISGDGLEIGGEGMKGFYDKILPAFMNKYGKKWGIKVEDIDLSNLEKGLTMHSVPVTEEMKASVMDGQVMFKITPHKASLDEIENMFYALNKDKALVPIFRKALDFCNEVHADIEFLSAEEMAKKEGIKRPIFAALGWAWGNKIRYNADGFNASSAQENAATILHEMLHMATAYVLAQKESYLKKVDADLAKAKEDIDAIFEEVKSKYPMRYGTTDQDEMVAEMSNPSFRKAMKEGNLWERFVNSVRDIIGLEKTDNNRLDATMDALNRILDNPDFVLFDDILQGLAQNSEFVAFRITPKVQEEMDAIKASAIVMGNFMKAPNGQPTNLTEEQWLMVRTQNFRKWFGDWENDPENASKVVDENGEPMVVYHGTAGTINKFEDQQRSPGFWFVDREDVAEGYAESASVEFGEEMNVVPVFLNLRNPRTEDAHGEYPAEFALKSYVENDNGVYQEFDTYEEAEAYRKENVPDGWVGASTVGDQHDLVERARELGHDGVIMKDMHDQAAYAQTRVKGTQTNYVVFDASQIKSATTNSGEFSEENPDIRYRVVTDKETLDRLNSEPTIKVYRAMQLIDGKLYPPMSAKVNGKLREPIELGVWEESEEMPELADDKGYFTLNKGNGKTIKARYNPYFHASYTPLNDQFSEAQSRPNLVIVEVEIPASELTSGYKADKAKDSVGEKEWKAGVIQGKLSGTRKVVLSRWDKPVRIVPDGEVADVIVKMFEGKDITMPSNVVTPSLRAELEKRGVPFVETDNNGKPIKPTFIDVIKTLFAKGKDVATKLYQRSFFDVAKTPTFMKKLGLTGDRFTVRYGVIARHFGKDSSHDLTEEDWQKLPEALKKPFAITKLVSREREAHKNNGYRLYTTLQNSKGEYVVVGVDVKNAGRDIEVNAIATVFGRRENAHLSLDEEVIYKSKKITPEQSSLLERPNSSQYPIDQELSEGKGNDNIDTTNESEENISLRVTGTPTEDIVAEGVNLSKRDLASLAGDIFAALPEESRKKITDGLNGNILGLQDAILKLPVDLAVKENWNEEEREIAEVVAEQMTAMAGEEMTRPFSTYEGLWTLYNAVNKSTDLVSEASRALVRRNLGFDSQTLEMEREVKDGVRFRTVGNAQSNATASMYNRGAVNVRTRIKESFVDMNASVEKLVKSIEKKSGMKAKGFEDILFALNQQSSKGLASMESYRQRFLDPMFDAITKIMRKTDFKYADIVRYVILKHGLERNRKLAQRDARAYYQEIYDEIIAKINSMDDRQKRTYLTNAQLKEADAKAKLATLQAVDTINFTDEEKREHKRNLAKARAEVKQAEEYLDRAKKIRSMTEQDALDELEKIFKKIEKGTDSKFKELRENDYSGISSMFYDQLGVDRRKFSTEEEYQSALMQAKQDKYSTLADVETAAASEVNDFESLVDTKNLWKTINKATKETLRQQYEANMISKEQYENLRDMFEYYVPLRGFSDNTAEDMYTYYRKPNKTGYTKPILGAEGRKTEAESPFGWIAAMAGSAIASNVKNEAKLALYYFVSNRPDNGVATISKTWFVDSGEVDERGKKIFKPAYPPFTDDLSTDAAKDAYEQWQENMRDMQKKGQAYESGQRLNLGNAVVNIDAAHRPEHIVNVKVGGKDYTIVINGNPRAAQAINGDLNIEQTGSADYTSVFGPLLRWMSSVNTSYNPEFWVTNLQRDMLFTLMAINTKGDAAYRRKFRKNYWKAWNVVKLVARNEKGTIGNSYIEQQYKDFVKYGGVTGYTQIKDSETWEKEIEKYIKSKDSEDVVKGVVLGKIKDGFHAMHRFGESLEQVSRFAAFLTSREMGKSMSEAINDAKEITVNFNRKGSGKMITWEESKYLTDRKGQPLNWAERAMAVGFTSIAPLGRRLIMFFNAAIQGLNAMYKLYKKNPSKMVGWSLGYAALGVMNALIHAMLDDDDDYLDMPQYERRNSLMLGGNGVYFKWAVPQEARVFYALGDLAVESIMGRNPHQNAIGEALKIGTEILPINPAEGWKAFMPSVAIPFIELGLNEDYKGAPIYNEQKWLTEEERKRTAKWAKAYTGTSKVYIDIAKALNGITGGDEHDAGWINLQPEKMEHIVQSAFGGTIRTIDKFIATIAAAFDPEEEVTMRQMPFLNRFLTINDERFKNVYVNDVYDYYEAEALHVQNLLNGYAGDGNTEAYNNLLKTEEYKWLQIYSRYKKSVEYYQERIKVAGGTAERRELMQQQDELKRRMIKEISEL